MKLKIKNILLLLLAVSFFVSCSQYTVYQVKGRPDKDLSGGIFYALPKTKIRIEVTFERTAFEVAPYARYAQKYLALNVDTSNVWSIVSTKILEQSEPDPDNYYYVEPRFSKVSLQVSKTGILKSVNSDFNPETTQNTGAAERVQDLNIAEFLYNSANYNIYDHVDTFITRTSNNEEQFVYSRTTDEKSLEQRAEETAKLIDEIRQKKKEIIFGEYESAYTGESLKFVYEKLDAEERRLLQLFIGQKTTFTEVFYVEPEESKVVVDDQTVELFRFSPQEGVVDSTDQEASIIYCNIRCDNNLRAVSRYAKGKAGKKKTTTKFSNFRYRVPEAAVVSFVTPDFTLQKTIKISQYGTVTSLPNGNYEAIFDVNTGELLYLKKN